MTSGVLIILVVAVLSTLYLIMKLIVPIVVGDGLSKYTGAKRQLAEKAMSDISYEIDNKLRWAYTFHAEDVRPTTTNELAEFCVPYNATVSNDPNDPRYYTVIMTESQLFDVNKRTIVVDGCNAFGPAQDGPYYKR